MHYAIVTETWPPEINGVALTVRGLAQGLQQRGHTVDVIRPRQPADTRPLPDELLTVGMGIPRYPGMRFGMPARRPLLRRWRANRPDAVYIATEGPLGWSAMRAARALGIPVASGFHTRFDHYMRDYGLGMLEPWALRWMRYFHNASQATVTPTCELADFLRSNGFSDVTHLPRAVDTARFRPELRSDPLRAGWGVKKDDLAVLYFGRIAPEKNLALAIDAFRAIRNRRADARFVWVGDGPELPGLRAAHPDFVFCGQQVGEDLARHVASSDLFLFPSLSETFGNVTIEAMASGVATVAFAYGAAREHLRDGVHGAAIAGTDHHAFVQAACRLACDDVARQRLGSAAREAVSRLQPARVAADFDAILQGVAHREHRNVQPVAA